MVCNLLCWDSHRHTGAPTSGSDRAPLLQVKVEKGLDAPSLFLPGDPGTRKGWRDLLWLREVRVEAGERKGLEHGMQTSTQTGHRSGTRVTGSLRAAEEEGQKQHGKILTPQQVPQHQRLCTSVCM